MTLSLERINAAAPREFCALLDGIYERSPWIAEQAAVRRPLRSLAELKVALVDAVRAAGRGRQLALINAHARVIGRTAIERIIATEAANASAAPTERTQDKLATLSRLDAEYRGRFEFPFLVALQGPRARGVPPDDVLATIERRLGNHPDFELAEALRNIHRYAETRLDDAFAFVPGLGNAVWDWAEMLAEHSDPGYAERGQLTVTYLTDAHRACARRLAGWMRECGFDSVEVDAVGNVVGVYHGADSERKRLLTGSHYDTVRNAGRYDGRLGILVPMACVRELKRVGCRLPFGLEVVGFAEEEGQRYKAVFLGSGALTGHFDLRWLEQKDADGVTMRAAMTHAGLRIDDIATLTRDPARYLGFVEVHIEQGPVLDEIGIPLGIVTSINGGVRFVGEIAGMASHAGTTPMDGRRDAAAAAAELVLYVEKRASAVPNVVGTVGMLDVPSGSINVVPGRCRFSLDIRSTTDAARDACVNDVLAELARICDRRGVVFAVEETLRVPAAPSAPEWQRRWENAVAALGLPIHRMPSGAGHDAMKLHEVMPQAMLFVRGGNSGISHNPLETISNDDAHLAVCAFRALLENLGRELGS